MTTTPAGYVNSDMLIETQWLAERLQRRDIRIVDMGSREAYLRAHIQGALHPGAAEKANYIKDPDEPKYVMPKEKFEALMSSLGIGNESLVIAYDADGGHNAARLWWAMSYYGRPNCKLLNGGWNKWVLEKRPVSLDVPSYPRTTFTAIERPALIAYVDDIEKAIAAKEPLLLDVRSDAEWNGTETRGNKRSGRIPGAVHVEWKNFVTSDAQRTFKPASELQQILWQAGVTPNKKVTTYCQAGVRASHTAFVLKLLGYDEVAVYDASFSEWGNLDETPIEKDGKITTGKKQKPAAKKSPRGTALKPARKAKKPARKATAQPKKVAKPAKAKRSKATPARRKKPKK